MNLFIRALISSCIIILGMSTLLKVRLVGFANLTLLFVLTLTMAITAAFNESFSGVISIFVLIGYLLIRKYTIFKSVVFPLSTLFVIIIADYFVSRGVQTLFKLPQPFYELMDTNLLFNIIVSSFIAILVFLLSKIISIIINKRRIDISKHYEIVFTLFTIIAFLVVYAIVRTMDTENEIVKWGIYVICYSALTITMIIMYRYAKREIQVRLKEKEREDLKKYVDELEVLTNELSRVMHENSNIMLTMTHYIETNNMPQLADYFNDKIIRYKNRHIIDVNNLKALSHVIEPEIKSLLYCKIIQANEKKLKPVLDIVENISFEFIDKIDLSRMIGILIDNAIEGAEKCDDPKVRIGMIKKCDSKLIIINNTCPADMPQIYELFNENFSTKNITGTGHGLSNLSKLIDKYSNVFLKTEIKDGFINQCIEVLCLEVKSEKTESIARED